MILRLRAGNFNDGCGEGHVYVVPNMTWLSPPGWASSMTFNAFQPQAKSVTWAGGFARQGYPYQTVDVFAAASEDGKNVSLRLVNSGNKSRVLSLRLVHGSVDTGTGVAVVGGTAQLSSLTSPLTGADYVSQSGGVVVDGFPIKVRGRGTTPITYTRVDTWGSYMGRGLPGHAPPCRSHRMHVA